MKKKTIYSLIVTIILNTSFILCFIFGIASMFDFERPPIIEKNDFISYINELGCNINDVKGRYPHEDIEEYLLTEESSCPNYAVSYTVFDKETTAQEFYNGIENTIRNTKDGITFRSSVNLGSNYSQYITSTGNLYKIVVLNRNSVLYFSTYKEYQTDAVNLYKYFNYYYDFDFGSWQYNVFICSIIILLSIFIISMWKIEKKIRNKGWIVLIPFYNIYCLFKDILGSGWYFLLMLVPFINFILIVCFSYKLGRRFGKGKIFSILCIFFPTIFYPLIALDDSSYRIDKFS